MSQKTRQLVNYLQACFAWEYSHLGGQNLLSKSLRGLHFLTLETVFSGFSSAPKLPVKQAEALANTLERNTRSSDLWYGIFPMQAQFSNSRLRGKYLCAPLFIADLNVQHLDQKASGDELDRPMLMVNRIALARLLDNDVADRVSNSLQKIIDAGPLGKAEVGEIASLLTAEIPTLSVKGFELFPLLGPETHLASKPQSGHPVLTCAGAVYISKRSRQSMGVLHELGQLKNSPDFSTPVTHLINATSRILNTAGPLNVIGALSTPQRKAITAARQHSLSVVHGPPGTGKTHVLAMLVADQIANGQSVLVCTRNNAAIDVIEKVIRDRLHIEEAVVRGGSAQHLRQLRSRLMFVLQQGAIRFSNPQSDVATLLDDTQGTEIASLKKAFREISKQITQTDRQLNSLARKISRHVEAGEGNPSFTYRIALLLRSTFGAKSSPLLIAGLVKTWRLLHKKREAAVIAKLQIRIQLNVATVLKSQRSELSQLARSVTAREHNQRHLQNKMKYNLITQTLPLWMSSLADLSHILPLQKELFDVLIIDEASQADIASALPALHRAKRAVIIGDAYQLKHVSFLPNEKERELLSNSSLLSSNDSPSFRNDSILDWANRQIETSAASSFLDEHFRSAPPIIEFSNREFYGNQLKLLTQIQYHQRHPVLQLVELNQATRDAKTGANRDEAQAIVECLNQLIASVLNNDERGASISCSVSTPKSAIQPEPTGFEFNTENTNMPGSKERASKGIPATASNLKSPVSIAVISPFRAQVDLLEKLISKQIDAAAQEAVNLVVGTAHELQGEERDIVVFSSCIDNASSSGSLVFLSRADVLNVSITRAKQKQIVFLSRSVEKFDNTTLFGRYILHVLDATNRQTPNEKNDKAHSVEVNEILGELNTATCEIQTNIQIGSVRVDILFATGTGYLGIDLIGFGGDNAHHGLHRHELELFYRLKVPIVPVTAQDWQESKSDVVKYLNEHLDVLRGVSL